MQISIGFGDYTAIIIYMLVVVGVGLWFSRNEKTSEEYLLGGRKVPWFAVGISYMMSLLSTISLVAIPGEIFNHGLSLFILSFLYPFLSVACFYIFMRFYFSLKSFTPFEYLERRYDPSIRLLVSIIYMWTRLFYLAMVLFTTSKVFLGGAGWDPVITILIIGVTGIVYTTAGGMKAVIWTEVFQFFVLIGGIAAALYYCIANANGGIVGIFKYTFEQGHGLGDFAQRDFYTLNPYFRLSIWLLLLSQITQPLFYNCADQISIQRLLSTSSYNEAKKAIFTNSISGLPFLFIMMFIGMSIFAYYGQNPDPNVTSGDTAFFTFVTTKMPAPIPGLILAAMLAAAMSTLNSGLNSLSAVYLKEYQVRYFTPEMTEKKQVRISRLVTLGVGLFSIAGALLINFSSESLEESVVEAMAIWGSLGVIMVPVYVLAVTTRRLTSRWVWILCAIAFGSNGGMILWYLFSKSGFDGPIGLWVPLSTLIVAAILGSAGQVMLRKNILCRLAKVLRWCGILFLGMVSSTTFWYLQSNITGGGQLSFAWISFPATVGIIILGYIVVCFLPPNDEKYIKGLTLWSLKEKFDNADSRN